MFGKERSSESPPRTPEKSPQLFRNKIDSIREKIQYSVSPSKSDDQSEEGTEEDIGKPLGYTLLPVSRTRRRKHLESINGSPALRKSALYDTTSLEFEPVNTCYTSASGSDSVQRGHSESGSDNIDDPSTRRDPPVGDLTPSEFESLTREVIDVPPTV